MRRQKQDDLLMLVQSFFHNYLQRVRGASDHTIRAYRDTLRLFFLFLTQRKSGSVADLSLDDLRADAVLAFLDHVESRRGNSAATRNYRLAVLRSFVRHLLRHDVTRAEQYGRILALPSKRASLRVATYLEPEEPVRSLLPWNRDLLPARVTGRYCFSSTIPAHESVKP